MILSKEVKITVVGTNIKYFKNLGYDIKFGDIISVPIHRLSKGSTIKIKVKCDFCENEKELSYMKYLKNTKNNIVEYTCSHRCAHDSGKNKETCLKKYGDENYHNVKQIKKTNLNKYGFENVFQSKEIKERSKQTNLKKYGVNNPKLFNKIFGKYEDIINKKFKVNSNIELIDKIKKFAKDNNLDKLDLFQQIYHFVNNIKKIPLCIICKKNGANFHNSIQGYFKYCSRECYYKSRVGTIKVNLDFNEIKRLYIDENLSLNQISKKINHSPQSIKKILIKNGISIRNKSESAKNRLKRDGDNRKVIIDKKILDNLYVRKKLSIKEVAKIIDLGRAIVRRNLKEYGICRTISEIQNDKESKRKSRLRRIKEIERDKFNGNQVLPSYNKNSIPIIEQYGKEHGYNFQHAENGGEYNIKELGYWVDGYDKNKNIVIEYDERYHFNGDGMLKEKDINRQKEIEEFLGCEFIRIKEK